MGNMSQFIEKLAEYFRSERKASKPDTLLVSDVLKMICRLRQGYDLDRAAEKDLKPDRRYKVVFYTQRALDAMRVQGYDTSHIPDGVPISDEFEEFFNKYVYTKWRTENG